LKYVLLDDHAREGGNDVGGHRHDESVDDADANEEFDKGDERDKRTDAEHGRKISVLGKRRGGAHCFSPSCNFLLSSSSKPRLASSRRSLQICATWRPNASLATISELRGRGRAIPTIRFTLPGRYVITTMRSESCTASVMLWVMRSVVCLSCC